MSTKIRATIEDLSTVEDKAELVNEEIVYMSPTGARPGQASLRIAAQLLDYEERTGQGYAFGDNVGFRVNLPHRESFSPDAAFYTGELLEGEFLDGAPIFAVEVRSKHDYGPAAEEKMQEKRADYFACGTLVVWDVDVLREQLIRVYRAHDPDNPVIVRGGDIADAEPAVPGWRMAVDEVCG